MAQSRFVQKTMRAYKRFVKLAEHRDIVGRQIEQFERGMARGETLRLRNTTHGGFLEDPAQQKVFVQSSKR